MKLYELQSPAEVTELENQLDRLMYPLGIDVRFSRHFVERLLGREKPVTVEEVVSSFAKLKKRYKKKLMQYKKNPKGNSKIIKDFDNELNVIFNVEQRGGNMPELVNITLMKKDPNKFRTVTPSGSGEVLNV